jgi:hypothetical protein
MEGMTPVSKHDSYAVDLKIKNHMAMARLTKGVATREDIDKLIGVVNVVEALYRLGFGQEYKDEVQAGLNALHDVAKRGATSGKFILRAQEMADLNTLMELLDAQLEVITVKDMEQALRLVEQEYRSNKMRTIRSKDEHTTSPTRTSEGV